MPGVLRKSTASQVIELGPFLDDTDFKTAKTALTIANTDIQLRKAGGTTHASKNSGGGTHIANGYYYATLDATDTNTVGLLDVHVNATAALPVWDRYYVLEAAVYDELFAASATGFTALLGALNASAATGDPGTTVTLIAYLKQLVNILIGTAGIATFPASTTPANAVSLAEVIRQIYDEVAGVNGATPLDAAGVRSAVGLSSANLDTQLSNVQTAVDALPDDPDLPTGAVVSNGSNSATTFETDRTETATDHWAESWLQFTSGSLIGQVRKITAYNGTSKFVTVSPGFSATPTASDTFVLVNR